MTKRMLIMLGGVLLLAAALGLGFWQHIRTLKANAPRPGPQTVSAEPVQRLDWQPRLDAVGTISAVHGVDVASEVAGIVRKVRFASGQDVRVGEVLVELNADADAAQLAALQAAADLAEGVLKRDRAQLAAEAVAQAVVDADEADLKNRRALVAQQAALLAKKTIRAPFAGRVGITTVNPGQYLNPGDRIVTLQAIDKVTVDFSLPQERLATLAVGQRVGLSVDAYRGERFAGTINAISPKVDAATRNVLVEATIANPGRRLLPGMFARADVDAGAAQRLLTLPLTAVTYNPYGSTVFVVKAAPVAAGAPPHQVAQQVFVGTGATRGDQVAIVKGLAEGDVVVTSGQLKLRNGSPVVIDNSVRPANSAHPTPQEI